MSTKLEKKTIDRFKDLGPGKVEDKVIVFKYRKPEVLKGPRGITTLAKSDIMYAGVQVIRSGGEQEAHSHAGMDGLWFVLKGRCRFYGPNNKIVLEAGPHEGVFVPRNVEYWFESVGDEVLELLQVEAIDKSVKNTQTRYSMPKTDTLEVFDNAGSLIDEGIVDIGDSFAPAKRTQEK
jgi:mannose-6-phosphate isomerase-like protein (cupin superfamily)